MRPIFDPPVEPLFPTPVVLMRFGIIIFTVRWLVNQYYKPSEASQ